MPHISIRRAKASELSRIKYITKLAYKIPYKDGSLITETSRRILRTVFIEKSFSQWLPLWTVK